MAARWLVPMGVLLMVTAHAPGQGSRGEATSNAILPVGYLVPAASDTQNARANTVPYQPQPGDIILYDNFDKVFHFLFKLVNSSAPTHVAMVVARADGTPALLDLTGPHVVTATVKILDVETRLKSYPGVIMVRRLREPLTAEQSHALTQFAEAERGKSFAVGRVALLATPFCARTGLRQEWFGRTYPTRQRWYCSELVFAAGAAAQLYDAKAVCANATYPRDLAFDETIDLSRLYHLPVSWSAASR